VRLSPPPNPVAMRGIRSLWQPMRFIPAMATASVQVRPLSKISIASFVVDIR